jgi:hypothetical protein
MAQETLVSTSTLPTPLTACTARHRARRILRPLLVFVLLLRCAAALPPHRATAPAAGQPDGPLARVLAFAPVHTAQQ